jgi:alpha-tubulin suppressor-like RCC1 family protein
MKTLTSKNATGCRDCCALSIPLAAGRSECRVVKRPAMDLIRFRQVLTARRAGLLRSAAVIMLLAATLTAVAATPARGEQAAGVPGAARAAAGLIDVRTQSCAIDGAGVLFCWGNEFSGELGNGGALNEAQHLPTPVDTTGAIPDTWTAVTVGTNNVCAIATDATAWCWGQDSNGQLGNGAVVTAAQPSPSPVDTSGTIPDTWVAIAAGDFHTCAIGADGTAWCWGADGAGELGNGAALSGNQPSPTAVDTTGAIPDAWTAISAGDDYVCAIAADATAWCWGNDSIGKLGDGAVLTGNQPSPSRVDTTGPIPDTWAAITAASDETCAIGADATAWCWGHDGDGELGNGAALTGPQPSPSRVDTTGTIPDTWTAISIAPSHACAIAADGTAWCWGGDFAGRLGNGPLLTAEQPSPSPVDTAGPIPDAWTAISAGTSSTCAIAAGGGIRCWGSDFGGRLGNGPVLSADQPSPSRVLEFYRSLPAVVRSSTTRLLGGSLDPAPATIMTYDYGARPLTPLFGDWDGNGSETPGTFEAGTFKLKNSHGTGPADETFAFGHPRGFAVAGDFDGDGRDDVAVFRNGTWEVRLADDGATTSFGFGSGVWPATVPVTGDWDGDGTDGIGVYTLATGQWHLRHTASAGAPDAGAFVFWSGSNASYPVVGDWDGDGTDTVGVKAGTTWSLNNANDAGPADLTLTFGVANDLPMSWR